MSSSSEPIVIEWWSGSVPVAPIALQPDDLPAELPTPDQQARVVVDRVGARLVWRCGDAEGWLDDEQPCAGEWVLRSAGRHPGMSVLRASGWLAGAALLAPLLAGMAAVVLGPWLVGGDPPVAPPAPIEAEHAVVIQELLVHARHIAPPPPPRPSPEGSRPKERERAPDRAREEPSPRQDGKMVPRGEPDRTRRVSGRPAVVGGGGDLAGGAMSGGQGARGRVGGDVALTSVVGGGGSLAGGAMGTATGGARGGGDRAGRGASQGRAAVTGSGHGVDGATPLDAAEQEAKGRACRSLKSRGTGGFVTIGARQYPRATLVEACTRGRLPDGVRWVQVAAAVGG